jgi:hypothetical protein
MTMALERSVQGLRFENVGEHAVVVVAVVNYDDGDVFDWAAYIGVGSSDNEMDCYEQVAERGNKLSERDAQYYAPHLPIQKYRS